MSIRTATLALLALSTSAYAADSDSADREGHRAQRMERLATLFDLDDYQKAQVAVILEEQHQKRKAQREATRTETLERLRPVLSETQIKKFEALGGERRGRRHRHCQGNQEQKPSTGK